MDLHASIICGSATVTHDHSCPATVDVLACSKAFFVGLKEKLVASGGCPTKVAQLDVVIARLS